MSDLDINLIRDFSNNFQTASKLFEENKGEANNLSQVNRQLLENERGAIRLFILDGKIDEAMEILANSFPEFLHKNKNLLPIMYAQ